MSSVKSSTFSTVLMRSVHLIRRSAAMPPCIISKVWLLVCGYYNVWGLLKVLTLEDVGTAIPEDAPIDTQMRIQMKSALTHIQSAGYVHGDIARRNFCKRTNTIFLVDLETLAVGSTVEMEAELAAVDAL